MKRVLCLLALFVSTLPAWAQKDSSIVQFGLIIDANVGVQGSGNFDFQRNNSEGQRLLGFVAQDGDFGEFFIGTGEIGLEVTALSSSGFLVRGDIHRAQSLFQNVNRVDEWYVQGQWKGRGASIGMGYGLIGKGEKSYLTAASLSLGSYSSQWEFFNNTSTEAVEFGNVNLAPESTERFSSNNAYLDLNLKGGPTFFLGKGDSPFCLSTSLSIGYRQSLNKGDWTWARTNESVEDINGTLMMGAYLKFCVGVGYIQKSQ